MVKVTDKEYYLDGFAKQIGDQISKRVTTRKQDILVIFNGPEGSGKTNASFAMAYYVAWKTGRKFDHNNVFFNLDDMIKFAGNNEDKIIVWDEAALGGLASDWTNAAQRKLKAMLMVCRKKRHVFFFNVPRFYRLSPDIIERALCMFHIYENKEEVPGNFMFYGRDALEVLYINWKARKYAQYWKFKKVHGHFTYVIPQILDEDKYEAAKDKAIMDLANDKKEEKPKEDKRLLALINFYNHFRREGITNKKLCEIASVDDSTLRKWGVLVGKQVKLNKNSLDLDSTDSEGAE